MKKFKALATRLSLMLMLALLTVGCQKYDYRTVEGDPLNAKLYTLPNGLKVYMTVNKEQPRIQTYIAVRTGGKNDPAETTGLAHYLEHLMFKGTDKFGTQNYEAEKPLLDEITNLYEVYRTKTDPEERKAIYHQIDSISGLAAKYAIPNEYDKMMSLIGAKGTNAYTSTDVTCYTEDIPSNQIENWAKIQAERFRNPVFRLFHTELEAVYEEKNMAMTVDIRKELEAIDQALFPNHPYGKQTVIGTQEHLKNPSLVNIRNYFDTWYVPDNIAICLSGDFDPDQMMDILVKYFGDWKASGNVPKYEWPAEAEITEPISKEVLGQQAENVILAWRADAAGTHMGEEQSFLCALLYNGSAGLIDLDLNQAQKVQGAECDFLGRAESSEILLLGSPLPGQTLDQVKDLLLAEVAKLRNGDFSEELLKSVLIDIKLSEQKTLEENSNRASLFVDAFVNGQDWADAVGATGRLSKLTKEDVVALANKYLKDDNFVCVYKRQGEDPNIQRIEKPAITPIEANRDAESAFLTEIKNTEVAPIEPVFVDFDKDLQKVNLAAGQQMLYKKNETNQLFTLEYIFDMGSWADRLLPVASQYIDYVGTSDMSADVVAQSFYSLGCSMNVYCMARRMYVCLSGLDENLKQAVTLLDKVLNDCQPSDDSYQSFVETIKKSRENRKANQSSIYSALRVYAEYGPEYVRQTVIPTEELSALQASELTDRIHNLSNLKHRVIYFGPTDADQVADIVNGEHHVAETLADVPANKEYRYAETSEDVVYYSPYVANNSIMGKECNVGQTYDLSLEPSVALYNTYFGGSMNGIVFQEMRETRGLAYSAGATFVSPSHKDLPYRFLTQITTQNDKLQEAYTHFNEIIEDLPESELSFNTAKESLIGRLRTARTTREKVLEAYIDAENKGINVDENKVIFDQVQGMTFADLLSFQQKYVKGRHYSVCLVSDPKQVDLDFFRSIGKVNEVSTDEVFGF